MRKARRSPTLRLSITDGRGREVRMPRLTRWLTKVAPATARGEIGLALVGHAKMRQLNHRYRHKDYPTDVLSFPATFPPGVSSAVELFLGDIAICLPVARRQAKSAGHSLEVELRLLVLHGLLHLLGYDHEEDQGEMERLEVKLRTKGGL